MYANRVIELLSEIYGRAIDWGYRGINPRVRLEPFGEKKRDRFIQPDELPLFFAELAKDTSTDFQHFVLLSLLCGARRANVLSCRWQDVDVGARTWRIRDTESKNDEPMLVPLTAEAVRLLSCAAAWAIGAGAT